MARVALRRRAGAPLASPFTDPRIPDGLPALLEQLLEDVDGFARVAGGTVLLKPNLNFLPSSFNPFALTDPRLLLALAAVLRARGARHVVVGEKPGQGRLSAECRELVAGRFALPPWLEWPDLDAEPRRAAPTRTRLLAPTLELPEPWLTADVVIDVPKLKTHTLTDVSLGMKNLFGLLRDDDRMRHHNEDLHPLLVDLLSVRPPDVTIVDALVGLEGQGPLFGAARPLDLLIASRDCVAADATAAWLMGFEPEAIEHLRLAGTHGLGEARLHALEFPALRPADVRAPFRRGDSWRNPVPEVTVVRGAAVPAGYANAISHSLERLAAEGRRPPPTTIYVGRFDGEPAPPGAIVFGDVTAGSLDPRGALVVPGHPPRAFTLYDLLRPA